MTSLGVIHTLIGPDKSAATEVDLRPASRISPRGMRIVVTARAMDPAFLGSPD